MPRTRKILLSILVVLLCILSARIWLYLNTVRRTELQDMVPAPQFTDNKKESWLNSEPVQMEELAGSVVLIFVWTYG